jgi:plasmid maintenance system antidote protein VapI
MKIGAIVKSIFKDRNISYMTVAENLGYKHASAISNRLDDTRPITSDILLNILEELDCELVIRSKKKDRTEWVVSGTSKE